MTDISGHTNGIFDNIGVPIMIISPEYEISSINQSACDAASISSEEAIGKKCYSLFHNSESSPKGCPMKKALLSGKTKSSEMKVEALGGQYLVTCSPVIDKNGKLKHIVHTLIDISEKVAAEKLASIEHDNAQKKQHEISLLYDSAKQVLNKKSFKDVARSIFDSCCRLIGATSGYVALLSRDGMENEVLFLEAGGRPCSVDPSLPMPIRGLRAEAYKLHKAVYDNDFMNSKWMDFMPQGHVPLDNVMFAPLNHEGQTVGIMGIANKPGDFNDDDADIASAFADLAAIALMNSISFDSLKEQRDKYRVLFEHSNDAVYIFKIDGQILDANKKACDMLGYSQEQLAKMNIIEIHPEESLQDLKNGYWAVKEKGEFKTETRHRRKDGAIIDVEVSASRIRYESDRFQVIVRDVTELKKAKKAEMSALRKYQALFNSSNEGLLLLDDNMKFIEANDAASRLFGYSREELMGMSPEELSTEEAKTKAAIDKLSAGDSLEKLQRKHRRKDGSNFISQIYSSGFHVDGRQFFLTQVRDITKQVEAEKALQDSEDRFASFFKNINTGAVVASPDKSFVMVNEKFCEMMLYTEEELKSRTWEEITHPDDIKADLELFHKMVAGEIDSYELEKRFVRKDEVPIYTHISASCIRDNNGRIISTMATILDITQNRLTERKLQETRERFRQTFEQAAAGIAHVSIKGHFLRVNSRLCDMLGYSLRKLQIKTFQEITHPDDLDKDRSCVGDLLLGKTSSYSMEKRFIRKDGSFTWVNLTVSLVRKSNNEPDYFISVIEDIMDRKLIEENLRKSEQKFRAVLDAAPFPVAVVDREDDVIHFWSRSALGLFGHIACTTDQWYRIAYPDPEYRDDVIKRWKLKLEEAKQTGKAVNTGEYKITCVDGTVRTCELYATYVGENLVVTFNDITVRKEALEELQREKTFVDGILNEITDTVYVFSADTGAPIRWNQALVDVSGYSHAETASRNAIEQLYSIEDQEKANSALQRILMGKKVNIELELIRKDGGKVPTEYSATMINNTGGDEEKNIVVSVGRDLRERKQAEAELIEAHELNKAIIETSPIGIALYDETGQCISANESIIGIVGASKEQALQQNYNEIESWKKSGLLELAQSAITDKVHTYKELELKSTFDKEMHIECHFVPIKRGDLLLMVNDVTERMQHVKEKEALQKQLLQSQKMEAIGNLAGGVAHDFNNMLTVIMGSANLLQFKTDESDPKYADLCSIVDAAESAKDLTMKLLTFARRDKLEVRNIPILDIIDRLKGMLERSIPKNISIKTVLTEKSTIQVDTNQIQHALLNICNNAVDAMPDGGTLMIETGISEFENEICSKCGKPINGKYSQIRISDTGTGIPSDMLNRIVEPFYTTKGAGKGTGLGLSVTHGIIESHDGHLHIYSEVNKGTCINVYLPAIDKESVEPVQPSRETVLTGTETILIIDDEESVLTVARRLFTTLGYTPIVVDSGRKAIDIYREKADEIAVVVLDLMMPEMDGMTTYKILREINPDVRVLISSGFSVNGHASEVMKLGARGFVQKPFKVNDMFEMIRKVIDSRN